MTSYTVLIERGDGAYSAYLPDLPGCVATGTSIDEVDQLIREAVALHVESLRTHGESLPAPTTAAVRTVEVT